MCEKRDPKPTRNKFLFCPRRDKKKIIPPQKKSAK